MEFRKVLMITLYAEQEKKKTQIYRTVFWTLWEKARVGCFKRTASKHVYYLGSNRSPAQVGCMRQALGPGALGKPRGSGWRGRWEGWSGWGTHVNPWLFHFNVWQNPPQKKKKKKMMRLKCCTQYARKFGKFSNGHRTGKGQFSFQSQRMFKLPHNCTYLTR